MKGGKGSTTSTLVEEPFAIRIGTWHWEFLVPGKYKLPQCPVKYHVWLANAASNV